MSKKKKGNKNDNGNGDSEKKARGLGTFADAAVRLFGTQNEEKCNSKTTQLKSTPIDGLAALREIEVPDSAEKTLVDISEEEMVEATAKIAETKELAQNIGTSKIQKKTQLSALREIVSDAPEGWGLLPDGNAVKDKVTSAKKQIAEIEIFLAKVDEFEGTVVGEQVKFAELIAEIQCTTEKNADDESIVIAVCQKIVDSGRFSFLSWEEGKTALQELRRKHGGFPPGAVLSPWGVYLSERGDGGPSEGQKALESNFRTMTDRHKEGIPSRMKLRGEKDLSKLLKRKEGFFYIYVPERQLEGEGKKKIREGHVLLRKFDSSEKDGPPRWDVKIAESFGSTASLTKEPLPFFWLIRGFPATKKGSLSDENWSAFSRVIRLVRLAIVADKKAKSALEKAEENEKVQFEAFKKKKAEKEDLQQQRQREWKINEEYRAIKEAGNLSDGMNWKKFLAEKLVEADKPKADEVKPEVKTDIKANETPAPADEPQLLLAVPEEGVYGDEGEEDIQLESLPKQATG